MRSASDSVQLTPSEAKDVDTLLGQRLAAKKARDFEKADELQDELRCLGVELNDKSREWHVRPARFRN